MGVFIPWKAGMVDHSTFREKVDAIWKIAPDATFSLYRPTFDLTPTMASSQDSGKGELPSHFDTNLFS